MRLSLTIELYIPKQPLELWGQLTPVYAIPKEFTQNPMKEPKESSKIKSVSKQVLELQKALEKANLKIDGLQTMIQVSEEELKIKIRKKLGAKRSKE